MMPWTASASRTVLVQPPQPLRGVRPVALPLAWPGKAAVETLDFTLDLSAAMADAADSICSVSASVTPAEVSTDLGIVWIEILTQGVVLTTAGGTAGTTYEIGLTVRTAAGRTAFFLVDLPIDLRSPSAVPAAPIFPPNAALLPGGVIIQDPTGAQPIILG